MHTLRIEGTVTVRSSDVNEITVAYNHTSLTAYFDEQGTCTNSAQIVPVLDKILENLNSLKSALTSLGFVEEVPASERSQFNNYHLMTVTGTISVTRSKLTEGFMNHHVFGGLEGYKISSLSAMWLEVMYFKNLVSEPKPYNSFKPARFLA